VLCIIRPVPRYRRHEREILPARPTHPAFGLFDSTMTGDAAEVVRVTLWDSEADNRVASVRVTGAFRCFQDHEAAVPVER